MPPRAEIGIFGGSGFYSLLRDAEEFHAHTPYGAPSGPVTVGEIGGRRVAFIARHGPHHEHPPHRINYRANLWAFRDLGVTRVVGPAAAGSLQPHIHPGDAVVCDQLVDRTSGRDCTFFDGPRTVHVAWADPYCAELRPLVAKAASGAGMNVHERGTVVVIQGPRFSTRAESRWYASAGFEVINMTQYPEAYLARELEMCYANLSVITDYDVAVEGSEVTMEDALRVFSENLDKLRVALHALVETVPSGRACECARALDGTPAREA